MLNNPWLSLRKFFFDYLHDEKNETRLSKIFNHLLIALIIGNVIAVLLESVNDIYKSYQLFFDVFENISIVIFSAEYMKSIFRIY